MKIAVPVLEREINGRRLINPHFGRTSLFAIVDLESGRTELMENPGFNVERGRGRLIAEGFLREDIQGVLVKEIGSGAFERITDLGIRIFLVPSEVKFLEEAIELFKEEKLKPLREPNGF